MTLKQILSRAGKHARSHVKPANCARSTEQARAAANARWAKHRKEKVKQ